MQQDADQNAPSGNERPDGHHEDRAGSTAKSRRNRRPVLRGKPPLPVLELTTEAESSGISCPFGTPSVSGRGSQAHKPIYPRDSAAASGLSTAHPRERAPSS